MMIGSGDGGPSSGGWYGESVCPESDETESNESVAPSSRAVRTSASRAGTGKRWRDGLVTGGDVVAV